MSRFVSAKEAARQLDVSPVSIHNWHKRGIIPGSWREAGVKGKLRIPQQWVLENTPEARQRQAMNQTGGQ